MLNHESAQPNGEGLPNRMEAIKLASRLRDHAVQLLNGGALVGLLINDLNDAARRLDFADALFSLPVQPGAGEK